MAANTIEDGKFKVQTVGPGKKGTAKSTGKPFKTFDLQFHGDPSWYNCYWVRDTDPVVDEELEGTKQEDSQFGLQFKMKFSGGGNKANWNPAASNATVMAVAVSIVNGFLSLKPEHLAEWEKKRKNGQTAVDHYLETVFAITPQVKQKVVEMGGNETQSAAKTSSSPTGDGDPGPAAPGVESWPDGNGEEEVDLGPM